MIKDNIKEIKNKIWDLYGLLRGEINSDDYSVVLLLIYLQSNNLLVKTLNDENPKESLITVLECKNDSSLSKVYDIYMPTIKILSNQTINRLLEKLNSIDPHLLQQNLVEIFDDSLNRIVLSTGVRSGEFIQPNQLSEFINAYIGPTIGMNIFNPFAGVASSIKDIKDSKSIYSQEIDPKIWAIGQLRLIINKCNADYKCDDSILNWPSSSKFDLIVSNPPFRLLLNGTQKDKYPEYRNVEEFLLGNSINSISENGRIITVLDTRILYKEGREARIREDLIYNDLIDTIISFPGGLLYHTNIPFVIVFLNKAKKHANKIKLVNALPFVSKPSLKDSFLDVKELLKATINNDSDTVRVVSNKDVIKNNFNLSVARYFQDEIEGVKLGDILKVQSTNRIQSPETARFIRIRDLKNDSIDFKLDIQEIEEQSLDRLNLQKIDATCLLMATKWKTLKPTFFKFQNEPIFIGSDILAFKINEKKVDINFLVNELHNEYVQKQFESFIIGSSIPFIRKDDLLNIKIKLPELKEQRYIIKLVQKAKNDREIELLKKLNVNKKKLLFDNRNHNIVFRDELEIEKEKARVRENDLLIKFQHQAALTKKRLDNLNKIKQNLAENLENQQTYSMEEKVFTEFASLKHTLGTPCTNILSWSKNLANFFIENEKTISKLNIEFRNFFDKSILEAIHEINHNIQFISDVLEKGENGLILKEYDKTMISLKEINNLISDFSSNEFIFLLKKQLLDVDNMDERGVVLNKALLKALIDNLLTNANKHGFDIKKEGNLVVIELDEIDDKLIIDVRNNGLPFPKNFDRQKFITKFKTANQSKGSGLGGYDINRIATYFENESWELNLNNPIYPVIFRFSFSIKPIN